MRLFRKKDKKNDKPDPFDKEKDSKISKSKKRRFNIKLTSPFKKKYRIGILLKIKRVLAGLILIVNLVTGWMSIQYSASFFFFLNSFIIIDYLWKTRKKKIAFES